MHPDPSLLKTMLDAAIASIDIGHVYTHYRSPEKKYRIITIALNEETETPCVVYQALYGDCLTWIRPITQWIEHVPYQDTFVPRFSKVQCDSEC